MNTTLYSKRMFCAVLVLFASSLVAVSDQAAGLPPVSGGPGSDTTIESRIAAGAASVWPMSLSVTEVCGHKNCWLSCSERERRTTDNMHANPHQS